jgi:hypothetical protein
VLDGADENSMITDAEIESPRGWFAGEWIDANLDVQGRLKGRWIASEEGKGFFHGIWGMLCSRAFLPDDSDGGCAEDE